MAVGGVGDEGDAHGTRLPSDPNPDMWASQSPGGVETGQRPCAHGPPPRPSPGSHPQPEDAAALADVSMARDRETRGQKWRMLRGKEKRPE